MSCFQSHISRLGVSILYVAIISLSACTSPTPSSSKTDIINSPAIESQPEPTTNPVNDTTNASAAQQFTAIIGTQAEGWLPSVLADKGLREGLTPAETGEMISGAEQVSDYGFSKVAVNDIPGLKQYEFYFAQDSSGKPTQLESVKLIFDPALNQAYPDLVKVLSNKYGEVKPEDVEQETIVWVGPDFVTAQLTKQVTDFGSYELNVSLPAE